MVVAAALEWWKPLQLSLPQCSVLACSALPIDLPAVAIDRRAAAAAAPASCLPSSAVPVAPLAAGAIKKSWPGLGRVMDKLDR